MLPDKLSISIVELIENGYLHDEEDIEDEVVLLEGIDNYLTDEYGIQFGFEIEDKDSEFIYITNIDWEEE